MVCDLKVLGSFFSVEDKKNHALLFAHPSETKIGFGFGLASYSTVLEDQTGVGASQRSLCTSMK